MSETELINRKRYNRIRPEGTVWHLGDFAYGFSRSYAEDMFRHLNGRKFLVIGNHDQLRLHT